MPNRILLALLIVATACLAAGGRKWPADLKDFDDPALKRLTLEKDPETGFVVGGKNNTVIIRMLTRLNGRPIADLEADMRPHPEGGGEHTSIAGFLGTDERLLGVLAEDNRYVVEELGLTHQALAWPMMVMGHVGNYTYGDRPKTFVYHGRRLEVRIKAWKGSQWSPFLDKTETNCDAIVKNLENGKELQYSLLVPQMIERYGFYEGKGTRYRVEPRKIVEVFDFLTGEKAAVGTPVWWWVLGGGAAAAMAVAAWLLLGRKRG
jgi:hypothetical protein